jgi:hypothetical protein
MLICDSWSLCDIWSWNILEPNYAAVLKHTRNKHNIYCWSRAFTCREIQRNSIVVLPTFADCEFLLKLTSSFLTSRWPRGLWHEMSLLGHAIGSWVLIRYPSCLYASFCVCVFLSRQRPCNRLIPCQRSPINCKEVSNFQIKFEWEQARGSDPSREEKDSDIK